LTEQIRITIAECVTISGAARQIENDNAPIWTDDDGNHFRVESGLAVAPSWADDQDIDALPLATPGGVARIAFVDGLWALASMGLQPVENTESE